MSPVSIKKELDTYFPLLSPAQQNSMLSMVKSILNTDSKRISAQQYNQELDEALQRVKNGKGISHEDVKREAEEW
jgi:hypothetical protein